MAYAQPAYRMDAFPAYAPNRTRKPDVRVVPGTRDKNKETSTSSLVNLAIMLAVLVTVVAVLSCVRIALTSATVTTMLESDTISTQISTARSTGTSLEMEQSALSSTPHLRAAAKKFGMQTPYIVGTIALDADVVATDGAGNLSLSGTVKNAVGIQE